jgi:hypothetical protein
MHNTHTHTHTHTHGHKHTNPYTKKQKGGERRNKEAGEDHSTYTSVHTHTHTNTCQQNICGKQGRLVGCWGERGATGIGGRIELLLLE